MIDWDERYAADEYVYGTMPNDFVARQFNQIPMGQVLCLAEWGCEDQKDKNRERS